MRGARSADDRANPRKRRENHVDDDALHENLKGAVPIAKVVVNHAKYAVDKTENHPGDDARGQQISGPAKKPQQRNRRKKAEHCSASDIALERKTHEERSLIGDDQPGREDQTEANAGVDAGAGGCVVKELQPARTRQVCSESHSEAGPPEMPALEESRSTKAVS